MMACLAVGAFGPGCLIVFEFLYADTGFVSATAHSTFVALCALFEMMAKPLAFGASERFGGKFVDGEGAPDSQMDSGGDFPFEGY